MKILRGIDLTLTQHKFFKQAEEVPSEEVFQYLKSALLARTLVYHKHFLTLKCHGSPKFVQVYNNDKEDLKLRTRRAYTIRGFPYIDYEVIPPKQMRTECEGSPIQISVTTGTAKSTNHKGNVIDVLLVYDRSIINVFL